MSTLTLNLDDKHMTALEELAEQHEMTKSQVMRQALRLYQHVNARIAKGEQIAFTKDGIVTPLLIVGVPPFSKG